MSHIYHITTKEKWELAKEKKAYDFCALETEGFIHCSTYKQTSETAIRFFKDAAAIIVLKIEESKVESKLIYEKAIDVDEMFPHIYGPININSIVSILSIVKDDEGHYVSLEE